MNLGWGSFVAARSHAEVRSLLRRLPVMRPNGLGVVQRLEGLRESYMSSRLVGLLRVEPEAEETPDGHLQIRLPPWAGLTDFLGVVFLLVVLGSSLAGVSSLFILPSAIATLVGVRMTMMFEPSVRWIGWMLFASALIAYFLVVQVEDHALAAAPMISVLVLFYVSTLFPTEQVLHVRKDGAIRWNGSWEESRPSSLIVDGPSMFQYRLVFRPSADKECVVLRSRVPLDRVKQMVIAFLLRDFAGSTEDTSS